MFDIKNISEDDAKKELEYLAKEIEKADIAYYQNDEPYLDDAKYDELRHRNRALEAKFPHLIRDDSPSKRVGAKIKSEFKKVDYKENIYTDMETGEIKKGLKENILDNITSYEKFDEIPFLRKPLHETV